MQKPRSSSAMPHTGIPLMAFMLTLSFGAFGQSGTDTTAVVAADQRVDEADMSADTQDPSLSFSSPQKHQTFGWIESVILSPELRWKLDAKLDTGADTSSLDAKKIRRVRYKGKSYVRFSIRDPESGDMVSLRRPYVRTVRIRRHSGNHQRRQVVLMTVCLGNAQRTIEVTLTDREVFDYPMLLGRSALAGMAIVDPSLVHTSEPVCKEDPGEGFESSGTKTPKEAAVTIGLANSGDPRVLP